MEFAEIVIRVPQSRLSSTAWILAQTPVVVADALEIAAGAYHVVQREANCGELAKHAKFRVACKGEDILVHAHQSLELGSLDEAAVGCYKWTYAPPGCDVMCCTVSVTASQRGDVKNEVTKHLGFVEHGVASEGVTCGLFISLACRIPNTRSIEMRVVSGVPVMYFSSDATDDISEVSLVTTALRVMSQLSHTLQRRTIDDKHTSAVDVSNIIKGQLARLDLIDEQIKSAGQVQKGLLELRESMVSDILTLRTSYRDAPTESQKEAEAPFFADRWSTPGGQQFLDVFKAAKRGKRYPTDATSLLLEGPALIFIEQNPDAFAAAKEKMKKENRAQTRGTKRKAASADEDADGDE